MLAALAALSLSRVVHGHEERAFLAHMRLHNLLYTGSEYHFRLGVFLATCRYVSGFNRGEHSFTVGLTSLATLTPSEYVSRLGHRPSRHPKRSPATRPRAGECPASFDWRSQGIVPAVDDLGTCTADWAWGAVRAAAGQNAILYGTLPNLSIQNLIDCDTYTQGCAGGSVDDALYYVWDFQGGWLAAEDRYPYTGHDGECYWSSDMRTVLLFGCFWPFVDNETALWESVCEYGLGACTIDASHASFQMYNGGIYDEPGCSSTSVDHVVMVVGFGSESGRDFWIVQNNWGVGWGEQGYIRMSRNKGNQCGIATQVTFPIVY